MSGAPLQIRVHVSGQPRRWYFEVRDPDLDHALLMRWPLSARNALLLIQRGTAASRAAMRALELALETGLN